MNNKNKNYKVDMDDLNTVSASHICCGSIGIDRCSGNAIMHRCDELIGLAKIGLMECHA